MVHSRGLSGCEGGVDLHVSVERAHTAHSSYNSNPSTRPEMSVPLFETNKLNSCSHSGESGAGKTESTKFIIRQLMELCQGNTQLEQQILQVGIHVWNIVLT